jgi:hypothetical protein
MEFFLATPETPRETALSSLRESDVMVLVVGFKAGTLLPDGSQSTYTSAEYDEALRLEKECLVFIKTEKRGNLHIGSWHNDEVDPSKSAALEHFKTRACENSTPDYFSNPDRLALGVIQALEQWESRGRPGARKTFASFADYFEGKNSPDRFQILDFGTTLLGRGDQIHALNSFFDDETHRVCVLTGRGGAGKSKLLHDWAKSHATQVVFLKDEPTWHDASDKEIPVTCKVVIVDDAHRQETFGKLLQVMRDAVAHRKFKLVAASRPSGTASVRQQVLRHVDMSQLLELPELPELDRKHSHALAAEVLGNDFRNYAPHLAEIASNSPLVIVAGGRLIASRRIDPSTLTSLDEFRSTIFNRLLDEFDLRGPSFAIDPPLVVLQLIAALGPVNVEAREFQESAKTLLGREIDEILSTVDALSAAGIVTPRPKHVRVIPDVLSDYILEDRSIGQNRSTRYAERVYAHFGAHSLKSLMRNLAELDWRRGQQGESGLNLLSGIWADIHERFRAGDEYDRHRIIEDLSGAAIYQPDQIIALVRTAIDDPISTNESTEGSPYRAGQDYVLEALPDLLEATTYHASRMRESITILWELATRRADRTGSRTGAQTVLRRLASWHRFVNPAFNFSVLVEAIRLAERTDAFGAEFTPFTLIRQILEREGEFREWQDDTTLSFGGFGLNYAAVGPVRESALDYLDYALHRDGILGVQAVSILQDLLHAHLTRVGRQTTQQEHEWQSAERHRCLDMLIRRFAYAATPVLRARIFHALRSGTGINVPESVRSAAQKALSEIIIADDVAVVDAICTAEHALPMHSTDFSSTNWEQAISELMIKGRSSLETIVEGAGNQARFTIDQTRACIELHIATGGFHRFMLTFADRPDYLAEMADQLIGRPYVSEMVGHLSSVFNSIHVGDPSAFRERALTALHNGAGHVIHAAAGNLRVFEGASDKDIAVIQAYAAYPDRIAQRGALFAITYMGKFTELRQQMKAAVLKVRTEGNESIAVDLASAFGPYGVPLTILTPQDAAAITSEFLHVSDWDAQQGAIPRFLTYFATLFPDEAYGLLIRRIELGMAARAAHESRFPTFRLVHGDVSFSGVPTVKRLELSGDCIARLLAAESADELAELFWDLAGYENAALGVVLDHAVNLDSKGVAHLAVLIEKAIPRLAFSSTTFVRDLLSRFSGAQRDQLVEAFAFQARHLSGGLFVGNPDDRISDDRRQFENNVAAFSDVGLEDLARALRRLS